MVVLCAALSLLALLLLVAAFKLPRRVLLSGRPEKRRAFLARRYTLVFEAVAIFLVVLMDLSTLLGMDQSTVIWPIVSIVFGATIVPIVMSLIVPGMIGGPN